MSKGAASSSDAPCSSDAKAPKRRAPTSASPATEESATKRSKSAGKKTAAVVEQAAENGVILKIVVENFMNHGHMQIDLDRTSTSSWARMARESRRSSLRA